MWAMLTWGGICIAQVWLKEDWKMRIKIFFYKRTVGLFDADRREKPATKKQVQRTERKTKSKKGSIMRLFRVLRTMELSTWDLAIDSGDYVWNAKYYMLNFYPEFKDHLRINFAGQNFLCFVVKVQPWKVVSAFFR
jgi:hypothetical protein